MSIRQHEEWVPSNSKCYGYVNMGTGASEMTLATNALVFILNCINGHWKIPVGYFLIAGVTGEQKKGLVIQCLEKCHDVGIKVVSLTCDGPPVNVTMAKRLGCEIDHKNLKTNFKHPSTNEDVVLFMDPSHMVKLIRNTLGEKGSFVNFKDEIISWEYFKELHKLQESESFHLANKIRAQHIAFWKQKMKVRLATQVFSESVAKSLEFCGQMNLPQFAGVDATVNFTLLINNLFDVLNSRNLCQLGYKKPLCEKNVEQILTFLHEVDIYISELKTHKDGKLLLESDRHMGFLGLKICISSIQILYKQLIVTHKLKFLPLHKISQDHIELYFGVIRSHGGHNNNPTARQFQAAYKKTICHVELQESFRGNCIPLEHIKILKCNPIKQINMSSRDYRINENAEITSDEVLIDHDYLPDVISEFSKQIIAYIAGHVVHSLKKTIMCEECVQALCHETKTLNIFSFIQKKENFKLEYPSVDVLEICLQCERILKGRFQNTNDFSVELIISFILRHFTLSNVFSNLLVHSFSQSPLENHRVLLIKAVAIKYANIRFCYLSKSKNNKSLSIRHKSNKLVLFKGQ